MHLYFNNTSSLFQNRDYIAMTVEIHFILHVVNGIHITILNFEKVYLHEFE